MLNILSKQLIANHWRAVLVGTASVTLAACTGGSNNSSSSVAESSVASSEVVVSSSQQESSASLAPESSSSTSSIEESSSVESSSSEVSSVTVIVSSSSEAPVSSEPVSSSSSEAPSSSSVSVVSSSSEVSSNSEEVASSSAPAVEISRPGYTVENIEACTANTYAANSLTLMGDDTLSLAMGGFTKDLNGGVFNGLNLGQNAPEYQVNSLGVDLQDSSCDDAPIWTGVLLKKYVDWSGQHANGLQANNSVNRQFNELDHVVIELKVNTLNTHIATENELDREYGELLNDVSELDRGNAAFGIWLSDNGDVEDGKTVVQAEKYIEVTPDQFDQWLRFTLPIEQMDFIKYTGFSSALEDFSANADQRINKVFFNPETRGTRDNPQNYGWVVRNFVSALQSFDATLPTEIIKEMSVSIKKFEIVYKDSASSSSQASSSSVAESSSSEVVSSSSVAPGPTDEERIAAGKALYEGGSGPIPCISCHGPDGTSTAFRLIVKDGISYENYLNIIENGVPGTAMPPCQPVGDCASQITDYVWGELNGFDLPPIGGGSNSSSSEATSSSAPASGDLAAYFDTQQCGVNYNAMGNGGWAACYRLEGGLAGCKTDMTSAAPTRLKWNNGEDINNVVSVSGYQSNQAIVVTEDGAAYVGSIGSGFDSASPVVSSGALVASGGFQAKTACVMVKKGNTRDLACESSGWGRPALPEGFDVMQVSAAYGYTCALNKEGEAWCWGSSPGMGSAISDTPSQLPVDGPLVNISASQNGFCGTKFGGGLSCLYGRYDGPPYLPLPDGFESPTKQPDGLHPFASNVQMGYKLGVVIDNDGTATLYSSGESNSQPLMLTDVIAGSGKRDTSNNGDASGILLMTTGGDVYAIAKGNVTKVDSNLRAESPACNF